MSHGCINTKLEDAKWMYDWANIGTMVEIICNKNISCASCV